MNKNNGVTVMWKPEILGSKDTFDIVVALLIVFILYSSLCISSCYRAGCSICHCYLSSVQTKCAFISEAFIYVWEGCNQPTQTIIRIYRLKILCCILSSYIYNIYISWPLLVCKIIIKIKISK